MKVLIASDLHGAAQATSLLVKRIEEEKPTDILLLGDILYHGPRNSLPLDYETKQVVKLLTPYEDHIHAVQGNCDAEVDNWMFSFDLEKPSLTLYDSEAKITLFATHGHRFGMNPNEPQELQNLPEPCVFCSGHTHIKVLEKKGNVIFVNPGSVGIPKDDCGGYAIYENGSVLLKKLEDGSEISRISFE